MKIKLFEEFVNEADTTNWILKLYNGIKNDYSIQRNTMGWQDVLKAIEKNFKKIEETDDQFENEYLIKAITAASEDPKLQNILKSFAKELDIALDTYREKDTHPEKR